MIIGSIVTIIVDNHCGVDREYKIKNETGVIINFDEEFEQWKIATGNPESDGWWWNKDEFREATDEEIKAKLRCLLMR